MPKTAIINRERLEEVNKMVNAIFIDSLDQMGEGELFDAVVMRVTSNQESETHNWMKDYSQLREWVGPRIFPALEAEGLTIKNKEYEASMEIARRDIILDRLGMLDNRVKQLPEAYFRGKRKQLADLILNGHLTTGPGGVGFDGVAFFSNAHPNADLANQSNVAASGTALDGANFDAAVEQMELLVNHRGEPMDITPDTLVIGPKLRASARSLFQIQTTNAGGQNEYFGAIDNIRIEQRITDNSWYLFDTSKSIKPIIEQTVVPMELSSQTDLSDDRVFNYNKYAWGIYAFFGMGYGLWQLAYRNPGV